MKKLFYLMGAIAFFSMSSCVDSTEDPIIVDPEISSVKITKITIVDFPFTNGGTAWDDPLIGSSTGADVQWKITGPQTFASSDYFPDCDGSILEFNGGTLPIFLDQPNSTYTLELWDIDDLGSSDWGSTDDLLSSISFTPFSVGATGTEILEFSNAEMTVQLELTYLFE